MLKFLGTVDYIVFGSLIAAIIFSGVWVGLKKKNAEDYFMAGRSLKWWSVAGSIYGTNVSLAQIIGMLGIGYSIGFAQSHYEILAVPAILLLCYVFIPVYRRRSVFTLSQFLEYRYNKYASLLYTIIIIAVIIILLVGGFYIGSRQLGLLFNTNSFHISYLNGIILIAFLTCIFIYFGGMESVVIAENIITVLMVLSVITVGLFTLSQPEIGGISGLIKLDAAQPATSQKMHLYLPSYHKDLPWTGVFSGLMVLHCFFWTTNQFEVQRILAAQSDRQAKLGAIAAGFLKLTIPFFSIAAGVAAAYLFKNKYHLTNVKPDDAFILLMSKVVPAGYGLSGLIMAGFTAAIFSSIYSMLNSASTLLSIDLYKKYIKPLATDRELVNFGKLSVVVICFVAGLFALLTFKPESDGNFFLTLSKNSSYLKPGIVSAFFLGVFWKKTQPVSAVVSIISAPFIGILLEWLYAHFFATIPLINNIFGDSLNFMHRVFCTFLVCVLVQIFISLWYQQKQKYTASSIDVAVDIQPIFIWVLIFILMQSVVIILVILHLISHTQAAFPAAFITLSLFIYKFTLEKRQRNPEYQHLLQSDLFYAGLLAAFTVWILYYFV